MESDLFTSNVTTERLALLTLIKKIHRRVHFKNRDNFSWITPILFWKTSKPWNLLSFETKDNLQDWNSRATSNMFHNTTIQANNCVKSISRSNPDIVVLFWSIAGHPGYVVNARQFLTIFATARTIFATAATIFSKADIFLQNQCSDKIECKENFFKFWKKGKTNNLKTNIRVLLGKHTVDHWISFRHARKKS